MYELNKTMTQDDFSYMGNTDIETIENLYQQYLQDSGSVDESWRNFFRGFEFARENFKEDIHSEAFDKEFKVLNLIDAYRKRGHLFTKTNPVPVNRQSSGSPATGLYKLHQIGQNEIIDKVFRKCDCELQNVYCGLQCVVGKSRKEILKQHQYFSKI